jgi:hypothetical protein
MNDMVIEYEKIAQTLVREPVDSAELKELQEYSVTCVELLDKLQDQLLDDILQRMSFLLLQQHKAPREEMALFLLVFNWPSNVKTFQQRAWEIANARKRELEMMVEGRQQALLRSFTNVHRKLEKVQEFGSLIHHEVTQMNKRIAGITQQVRLRILIFIHKPTLTHTHARSHSHTPTLTYTHAHSYSHTCPLSPIHIPTLTHTYAYSNHTHAHSHPYTCLLSPTHMPSLTHTHAHSHSHTYSLSLS